MNIWCIGRNYVEHAKELGNNVPKEPLIFLKSEDCLTTRPEIVLPSWSKEIHYELEIAVLIGGEKPFSIEKIALAIDLTARDKQSEAKKNGTPWSLAKSFKDSCPISPWLDAKKVSDLNQLNFKLFKNDILVQNGQTAHMIFSFDNIIQYVKDHFPLKAGDIILTGTPAGVGPLNRGDRIKAQLNDSQIGSDQGILLSCHWTVP